MRHITVQISCAMLLALAMPIFADEGALCPLSHDQYEVGVPHTDMAECPASMEVDDAYCRLSVVAEVATVFAFSEDTDCIVATKSYFEDEFAVSFN